MMNFKLLESFISSLYYCQTVEQSWNVFLKHIKELGFTSAMYIMHFPSNNNVLSPSLYFSNYRESFLDGYDELNSHHNDINDLATKWCLENDEILDWSSAFFLSMQTPKSKLVDDLADDFNMQHGVSIPLRRAPHLYFSGVGVCAEGISSKTYYHDVYINVPVLNQLTNLLHAHIESMKGGIYLSHNARTTMGTLSLNENETLKWLASGYTIKEISDEKLFKSTDSINLYIKSAKQKLKVRTRDQLIARAVVLGII